MSSAARDHLLGDVRRLLLAAEFDVTGEEGHGGLWVRSGTEGVLITWCTSHGFLSLAEPGREPTGGTSAGTRETRVRTMVHTSVIGLLTAAGLSVTAPAGDHDVLVVNTR